MKRILPRLIWKLLILSKYPTKIKKPCPNNTHRARFRAATCLTNHFVIWTYLESHPFGSSAKKECAIREDDACCATFTKKVAKKYFAFVSYEKKRIALQKRYGIIAIVTTRLFLQNGGKRRSYAYYKTWYQRYYFWQSRFLFEPSTKKWDQNLPRKYSYTWYRNRRQWPGRFFSNFSIEFQCGT